MNKKKKSNKTRKSSRSVSSYSSSSTSSLTFDTCSDEWDDIINLHGEKSANLIKKRRKNYGTFNNIRKKKKIKRKYL